MYVHSSLPSTTKNSSSSRAPKTGAQLGDNRRSAKNAEKPPNTSFTAANRLKAAQFALWVPVSAANWNVCNSGDELNLRHFHRSRDTCRCMITATSKPSINCGNSTSGTSTTFSTLCTTTGMSTTLSKNWTTQTRRQLRNLHSFCTVSIRCISSQTMNCNCGTSTVFSTVFPSLTKVSSTIRWRTRPGRRP